MFAVYGVLLLTSAVLVFIWAYGEFRRAAPKRWTTWESTSNVVVLTIISLLSFGAGLIIKAAIDFWDNPLSLVQVASIAAIIAVGFGLGRALRRGAAPHMAPANGLRPADMAMARASGAVDAALDAAVAGDVANDTGPGSGPRPVRGAGRRAA